MTAKGVSVIVASHRPAFARELAAHLGAMVDVSDVPTEIIFVCDYDTALSAAQFPAITFVFCKQLSISVKRNVGIQTACYSVCAFIDDDCLPEEGWIDRGFEYLERQPDCVGVEGFTGMATGTGGRIVDQRRLEKPAWRTNNIFYRRQALLEAGLFDERFSFQREDVDLAFTLLDSGGAIHAAPEIRVVHRHRAGEPWDYLKNCWRRRYDPLLHKKHPSRYRSHIGSPVPGAVWLMAGTCIASLLLCQLSFLFMSMPVLCGALLSVRRAVSAGSYTTFLYDALSFLVAPLVLWIALIGGSIRFKTLLLA